MKILNFGSCNLDYVYSLDHIVAVGETETADGFSVFPGGKGLNQSIAVARAGAEVFHAGCVGADGELLVGIMAESGVRLDFLKRTEQKTGHAVIQVDKDGKNSIFIYPGANMAVEKEYIDSVLEHFGAGDIVVLQNEISNVGYAVDRAFEKQMTIVFNPSPINEKIKEVDFGKLGYVILNEIEIAAVTHCDDLCEAMARLKRQYPRLKVILTLGEKGSVYFDRDKETVQPSFEVTAVDTTAAGDTFTGYFVAEISKGADCKTALRTASAASAVAVSRNGAAPSVPFGFEVSKALKTLKERSCGGQSVREKITEYIDRNVKNASLEALALELGYSTVYTGKLVKQLLGMPFSKAIIAKRCGIAAEMLLNTEMSAEDIIREVGYENKSYFRRLFKEKYGKTMLGFRKDGKL